MLLLNIVYANGDVEEVGKFPNQVSLERYSHITGLQLRPPMLFVPPLLVPYVTIVSKTEDQR